MPSIFTLLQFENPSPDPEPRLSWLPSIVPAAPDADIRGVHGVEAAENHGVGSQIDPGAGLELDTSRTVYAGTVVVGDAPLDRHIRFRGAGEEMQGIVRAVDLEREVPRLGARQRERDLLSLDPGLDPGPTKD